MSTLYGIGTDIVAVPRIERSLRRHGHRFAQRLFTPDEIAYCESQAEVARFRSFAARFAAKEAVSKAFRVGIGPAFDWLDLEVIRDGNAAPSIRLHGRATEFAAREAIGAIHLSLSHSEEHAIAYVVIERAP